MGWWRDLWTGGDATDERREHERGYGPRHHGEWHSEHGRSEGAGRDGQEWRAAGEGFRWGTTRAWDEGRGAHQESGWQPDPYGSTGRAVDRPTWGGEGGGGWYQGDYSRARRGEDGGERRYGPYEDAQPTSFNWKTGFGESPVGTSADGGFSLGVGGLLQPMRQPYGGATWTPESMGGYSVGESIYGRSVVRPDAPRRRRGSTAKGWKRGDERVREAVCDALMEHPRVDASDVEVEVAEGRVVLRGEVPDRDTKYLVEDLVESILGVEDVDNQLRAPRRT